MESPLEVTSHARCAEEIQAGWDRLCHLHAMWPFGLAILNPRRVGPNFDLPGTSTHAVAGEVPYK